jgi:hypothetical protein
MFGKTKHKMFVLSTKSFMDKNMFLQWVGIFFSSCVFKAGWIERDKSYIQRTYKGARRGDSCPQESHQFHSAGQLLDILSLALVESIWTSFVDSALLH